MSKLVYPKLTLDSNGLGRWVPMSGKRFSIKVEGLPAGHSLKFFYRYYRNENGEFVTPNGVPLLDGAGADLEVDKNMRIPLFEENDSLQINCQVLNGGVPVADASVAGLHVGM